MNDLPNQLNAVPNRSLPPGILIPELVYPDLGGGEREGDTSHQNQKRIARAHNLCYCTYTIDISCEHRRSIAESNAVYRKLGRRRSHESNASANDT